MTGKASFLPAIVGAAFAGAVFWTGAALALDPDAVKLPEMTPKLNLAQMSYDAYCASCHGRNAAGTDKGPTFLHRVYHPGHHGDQSFYIAALQGARAHHWKFGDMKPVEGVTEAQLQLIVTYVRALQKANGLF